MLLNPTTIPFTHLIRFSNIFNEIIKKCLYILFSTAVYIILYLRTSFCNHLLCNSGIRGESNYNKKY